MTTNELKDAAIFVMAYSFLKMDSTEELGLFINKKASKLNALDNKAYVRKENFGTTAPQLACDLLYLRFAPNERKGQRLAPILAEFYACNKDKIAYIANKSYDTKYRKEAEDSQRLAYFYIENI